MTDLVPPKPDELEVSIFGPGRGECVLVHVGNNEWCVVDSCIARGRTDSVAVEYLRGFQNKAESNIKLIVATHWHDDHIGGLASVLRLATNAEFSCSMALRSDEFLTLVSVAPDAISGHSGVEEFASILKQLEGRGQKAPAFAVENKRLLHLPAAGRSFPFSMMSLSPSNPTIKLALADIASLIPKVGEPQRRVVSRSPNHTSVVLWIEAGNLRGLLGADLEHANRPGEGWMAVIDCHQDSKPAQIFKVPHHGSAGADLPDVWQKMLGVNPVAVVTPFTGGRVRLPKETDLERLSKRTSQLYCTASGSSKPPKRDAAIDRTMRLQTAKRTVIDGQPGHVRIRWSTTDPRALPSVEVFNGAYHVN